MRRAMLGRILVVCMTIVMSTSWALVSAQTLLSDGYVLEDFGLKSAGDLVDICTLEKSHPDHVAAMAFCYGFFEGGIHYDTALTSSPSYKKLICDPDGTTRTDAVNEFVAYMQANPNYKSEMPIDAIFRALMAKWPCPKT